MDVVKNYQFYTHPGILGLNHRNSTLKIFSMLYRNIYSANNKFLVFLWKRNFPLPSFMIFLLSSLFSSAEPEEVQGHGHTTPVIMLQEQQPMILLSPPEDSPTSFHIERHIIFPSLFSFPILLLSPLSWGRGSSRVAPVSLQ